MDEARARELLAAERARLEELKAGREAEGIADIEGAGASELSSGLDQHPADVGSELFEREKELGIVESFDIALLEIDAAEQRLEDGTYGTCVECGITIPEERLEARPATARCVEHQAAAEHAGRA